MKPSKKPSKKPHKSKPKSNPSKPTRNYQAKPTKTTTRKLTTRKPTTRKPSPRRPTRPPHKPVKRFNRQAQNKNTSPRPYQKNKHIKKHNKPSPKPLIIRKGTPSPKTTDNYSLRASDKDMITREVLKNVMKVMQRLLTNTHAINNQLLKVLPDPSTLQKRSTNTGPVIQNSHRKFKSNYRTTTKIPQYYRTVPPTQNTPKKNNRNKKRATRRYKRELSDKATSATETITIYHGLTTAGNQSFSVITDLRNVTAKDNYYKYVVVNTTEKQNYRIHADRYNTSSENEVQQFAMKEKGSFVNVDELEQKPKSIASNENKVFDDKFILNESHSKTITLTTSSDGNSEKNISMCGKAKNVIVMSSTQTSIKNGSLSFNNVTTTNVTNRVHTSDVTIRVSQYLNKYTTTKKVDTPISKYVKLNNTTRFVPRNKVKSIKSRMFKKIADIQNIFKKLINDFRTQKNNTQSTTEKPKRKSFNIMKYLKKFFRKVFRRKTGKNRMSKNSTIEKNKLRNHVIEAVCEIFDNCVINKKNKKILEAKVNSMYTESNNIFRSIKIIKGLLHLTDIRDVNNTNGNAKFKDDITKLNYILKNDFGQPGHYVTENQLTQIKYIKNNTHIFIQSVGRFANILNDIIATLTSDVNKKTDLRNRRNANRDSLTENVSRNEAIINDFLKLKNILKKYNLLQNTFMKKMYETVNKFGNTPDSNKLPQVSPQNVRDVNTSLAIEKFSRNIIENLRKLRNLAVIMNSSNRRKRNAEGDGNTVEYLLTLMEYLLKKNYPLESTPAKDGIDVLIDAIKSSPDVKPAGNKAPNSISTQNLEIITPKEASNGDTSEDNRISKEDNVTNTPRSADVESTEQNIDQIKGNEYIQYQQVKTNIFDDNTEGASVFFTPSSTINPDEAFETTLSYHQYKKGDDAQNNFDTLDKYENVPSGRKKYDVFSADMEDEDQNTEATSSTVAPETDAADITRVIKMTTEPPIASTIRKLVQFKQKQASDGESSDGSDGDKRVSLDWLDEGYDQEGKASAENVTQSSATTTEFTTLTTTNRPIIRKQDTGVSSITKEFSEEYDKKDQAKLTSEQLMRQKQMDLLNSLDYGTEKSEFEDSVDSKGDKDDTFSYYS